MRTALLSLVAATSALLACGLPAPVQPSDHSALLSGTPDDPPPAEQGDHADSSCQVVLRTTQVSLDGGTGPATNCQTVDGATSCWAVITVTFDVAMPQALNQAEPFVFYQGAGSTSWQQSTEALPIFGAPEGYRRYQVALNSNTFTPGASATTVQLVPYLFEYIGERLFDHNRIADPLGAYQLTSANNWAISDDPTVCQGAAPTDTETLTFATGWNDSAAGTLAQGGKLDISYDLYRIPGDLGCTTDGVDAFATTAFVQFQPDGTTLSETVSGPFNQATNTYDSLPLEFDVPADATSAAVWFLGSSDCGAEDWDSNFGANYVYAVTSR